MATPPVEDPHLADIDSDTSLPPPPPHNLHSSYSMPSFSGNPIHRPYLSLNPIAASARTSFTRVDVSDYDEDGQHQDGEGDESSRPHDNQENSASPTADVHEDEKEHDHDNKEKKKEEDNTASTPPVESQSQRVETPAPPAPTVPQVHLTFLLISSRRRSMAFEPETTVGRVKELMWNTWPDDWQDERPPAPAYLRVLYLGKMLQDDDTLTKLKLPVHTPTPDGPAPIPTIVHISIRPSPPPGESDTMKKPRVRVRWSNATDPAVTTGEDANAGGCCGCVIC